ncbi:MAG: AAA family ATPase [Mycolicibacterium insubricum]|nr:AAA family ATPase [Mycobacterium sp.]
MLNTVAIRGYRSLRDLVLPLRRLTVITGANGSGKSSTYRALRLLADCGRGEVIGSLAREGGLSSALWAGPETLGAARSTGRVQGTARNEPVSLALGFSADDFGYLIDLGLPVYAGHNSEFSRDPEIKREAVFAGPALRPAGTLVHRDGPYAAARDDSGEFAKLTQGLPSYRSVLAEYAQPAALPELAAVRDRLRGWRFYDGFRADADAPARLPQVGTRTPVLADDGRDLAAALQTIIESTGADRLADAVADAFAGATVAVTVRDGLFDVALSQPGLLRPLRGAELSDGTLRFLLWSAALLSPEPPSLMVLNEPETSLHPELLAPLGRLIVAASRSTQVVVVTHSATLRNALGAVGDLSGNDDVVELELYKDLGETLIRGQGLLDAPSWHWGSR